jgi:dihydroorotate dehydrogenase electron transfer subunit
MILMRPISICRWDGTRGTLRFVYRAAGKGTRSFTSLRAGDRIDMLGILGNGYDLGKLRGKHVLLLGGGIGVPPMLELAAALQGTADSGTKVTAVMGYRNSDTFLDDEFTNFAEVYVATEDGSLGTRGNVIDAMKEQDVPCDVIFACGPMPMLRGIKAYAKENGIKAYLSLEERMACGVGACLGCVCKTKEVDEHSHVKNARICTDGPVFDADDLDM